MAPPDLSATRGCSGPGQHQRSGSPVFAGIGARFSGSLAQAVSAIPDAEESKSGYDRTLFRHWVDVDGDCQDTRAEVLSEAEADTPITYTTSGRCRV